MGIYVANQNGDWWQATEPMVLFVLDTDNLTFEQKVAITNEYGETYDEEFHTPEEIDTLVADVFEAYGVEDVIQEFGTEKTITF